MYSSSQFNTSATTAAQAGLSGPVHSGKWTLGRFAEYENSKSKAAIAAGKCAHTYYIENPIGLVPVAKADQAFEELNDAARLRLKLLDKSRAI